MFNMNDKKRVKWFKIIDYFSVKPAPCLCWEKKCGKKVAIEQKDLWQEVVHPLHVNFLISEFFSMNVLVLMIIYIILCDNFYLNDVTIWTIFYSKCG